MFFCRKKDGSNNYYLSEFPDEECLTTTHWMLLYLACLGILILIPLTFLALNTLYETKTRAPNKYSKYPMHIYIYIYIIIIIYTYIHTYIYIYIYHRLFIG